MEQTFIPSRQPTRSRVYDVTHSTGVVVARCDSLREAHIWRACYAAFGSRLTVLPVNLEYEDGQLV